MFCMTLSICTCSEKSPGAQIRLRSLKSTDNSSIFNSGAKDSRQLLSQTHKTTSTG